MEPTRTPWPLIGVLYLAGLIAATQFAKVSLTLGPLAVTYPEAPVAFAVSGVAAMGIVFGVVAGGITAQLQPRRAILIALAISTAAGLAQATLPSFPVLMGLRVLEGAGHLLLVVAVPTLMAGLAAPSDRSLVMGIWATFFGVGFALAALVIGQNAGLTYAAHAALAGILGLVLWRLLPRDVAGAPRARPSLSDHLRIYSTPRLFAPALGHGLYALLFLALVTYLPVALEAPWLAPVLPIMGIVGSLFVGVLARFVAPGTLVWTGFLGAALVFGLAALLPPVAPWLAILGLTITGIVAGGGFAAVPWLNTQDDDRALANGAMAQLGNIGTFSGTPILAALGASGAVPLTIVVGVIGAGLLAVVYRMAQNGRSCG